MNELKAVETETVVATPEQQALEADAAVAVGYNRAKGVPVVEPAVEKVAETTAKTEPVVEAKPVDPWEGVAPVVRETLQAIDGKMGKLTKVSHELKTAVGRFQSEVAAAKSVAKTIEDAPTQAQITAASHSLEEWNKLKADFEGWSKGIDERIAERIAAERTETLKQFKPQTVDVDGIKRDVGAGFNEAISKSRQEVVKLARAFGRVDGKYPDWETDVHLPTGEYTPEFSAWETKQAPDIRALADSESAADAIKMLEMFYDHRKAEAKREKNQARLATVVAPKQANSGGPTVLPDEAGLSVGYNRMAKQRA